jgi:ribosomal-protein-serine acetyltransferase
MFVIDSTVALRVLREDDAAELFVLTDANRAYLRRWLPWVDLVTSEEDSRSFLATVAAQRGGPRPHVRRALRRALAGVIGAAVDRVNRIGEIGYWLAAFAGPRRDDAMLPLRRALWL